MHWFCVFKYLTNDSVDGEVGLDETADISIQDPIQLMSKALVDNLVKLGGGAK